MTFVGAVALAGAAAAQTPARCKAFGDSITAGVGDDPGRETPGYPPRLEELVPGLVVDNRGVGAERTPEGARAQSTGCSRSPATACC